MTADAYYTWYPGDYMKRTGELSILEHGAYRVMLDHYYGRPGLPSDRDLLYRICRAFTQEERDAIDRVAAKFFNVEGDRLVNSRAEKEIEKRRLYSEAQSERGKLGGRPPKAKVKPALKRADKPALKRAQSKPTPSSPPSSDLSEPPEDQEQHPEGSNGNAEKIVAYYEDIVREDRPTGPEARKNVLSLLSKGIHLNVLWECVNLYADEVDGKKVRFRKLANNFFGRGEVYKAYVEEARQIAEKKAATK